MVIVPDQVQESMQGQHPHLRSPAVAELLSFLARHAHSNDDVAQMGAGTRAKRGRLTPDVCRKTQDVSGPIDVPKGPIQSSNPDIRDKRHGHAPRHTP
jgi:hypothetical protein